MIPPETAWLSDPDMHAVCTALGAEGGAVYLVGGCVRDALLHIPGSDIDMATPLLPQQITRLAEAAGLKVVPTGIDHGTVTVVSGGIGFEVTTFRKDVATDGRRAVVAFSTDLAEDAGRRDFTLNALYATPEGHILDPLDGLQDCLGRRIRFIGAAADRIREDYLRILRFFRFHAWYAVPAQGFDADALDAIAANAEGLDDLSAERVGQEMSRLLAAPDPAPALATMQQAGVLNRVLPGSDITLLGPALHLETHLALQPDWRMRLVALGGQDVADRLRLTRKTEKHLSMLRTWIGDGPTVAEIAYRSGYDLAAQVLVLRHALANDLPSPDALTALKTAAEARFPIRAQDFMPGLSGKALGTHLAALEKRWIRSGFTLTREELMTLD